MNIGRDGCLKITVWVSPLGWSFVYWCLSVNANLPIVNITSYSYEINNVLSDDSVSDCPTLVFRASSCKSCGLGFASTSTHVCIPHKSSATGHSILYDNFLSHHHIGIRASVFQCAEDQFLELCHLHGLHVDNMQCHRDWKTKLIYHLLNGDCFSMCYLSSKSNIQKGAVLYENRQSC